MSMSAPISLMDLLLVNLAVVGAPAVVLWLISLRISDVSIVDIYWGLGFVLIAWVTFIAAPDSGSRELLIAVPTTLWGVRLAAYLAWRNLGKGEDYRYQAMRRRLGPRFRWTSAFYVFGLQAALIWTVSLPIQLGQLGPPLDRLTGLQIAGVALFGVGFFFETVGDLQLARFKARPENRGKVMDRGLWRYTRHPNYFGDFMVWWGLYLLAVAAPRFFWDIGWTAVGPALMSVLLLRVSGVTLLEASLRRRKPEYQEYARRTSAFFPRPPRTG